MKKLKQRKMKLPWDHPTKKGWSWDLNPGSVALESLLWATDSWSCIYSVLFIYPWKQTKTGGSCEESAGTSSIGAPGSAGERKGTSIKAVSECLVSTDMRGASVIHTWAALHIDWISPLAPFDLFVVSGILILPYLTSFKENTYLDSVWSWTQPTDPLHNNECICEYNLSKKSLKIVLLMSLSFTIIPKRSQVAFLKIIYTYL